MEPWRYGWREGGRQGRGKRGREGGREGHRRVSSPTPGRKRRMEPWREEREGGREERKKKGREGGREGGKDITERCLGVQTEGGREGGTYLSGAWVLESELVAVDVQNQISK